ncbi:MAG: GntR family transcriptional regulator [Thermoanaerobacterium sp.]|nr:GntR family transcriptional regulator [Thermoanaerobacterium sp.]
MTYIKKSELAYNKIKDWLLNGNLKPGEIISSYKISEALNLSRTPIALALKKLEQEGFIEIIPQVGCMIKLPNINEAEEDFLIRAILEGFATEMATYNCSYDDINELKNIHAESTIAAKKNDAALYASYNKKFHFKITKMSKMSRLISLLSNFWDNISYYSAGIDFLSERYDISVEEHRNIISAIEEGDAEKARSLMENHLRKCSGDFCNSLKNKISSNFPK